MKNNRYPDGYQPKIDYWTYKMKRAIEQLDGDKIEFAAGKLKYFTARQRIVERRLMGLID